MASPALAQPPGEREALEAELAARIEALGETLAADCGAACEALASLRRAAARICELDPGPPCASARDKVADAERRVREACPGCAVEDQVDDPAEARPVATPGQGEEGGADLDETDRETGTLVEAAEQRAPHPPPSEAQGGCAACAVVGPARARGGALWLGLGLALFLGRRCALSRRRDGRAQR